MPALGLIAGVLLVASAANSDVLSEKPDAVSVAIYHKRAIDTQDLMRQPNAFGMDAFAFVTETRTIDLPAGPSIIRFKGVASTMVPETAGISGLPAKTIERNFDYDLLSPGSLLMRSVGNIVHLVRTDPATGRETETSAVVRAASDGAVLDIGGKLEALHCGGPPERLVFDEVPEGLTDTATLSVRTFSPAAGRYTIKLSYIAMNLNWSADYVAHIAPGGDTLSLTGWITLVNFSDTTFADAPTEVIAGNPNTTGDDYAIAPTARVVVPQCWPLAIDWFARSVIAAREQDALETVVVSGNRIPQVGVYASSPVTAVSAEDFSDYKLYALPERTTVAARQTKQIQFVDLPSVKFRRVYTYRVVPGYNGEPGTIHATPNVEYRMENRDDQGLGKPLPGGSISVMDSDVRGAPVFIGEQGVDDTPVGLPIKIKTGYAFDVAVDRRLVSRTRIGSKGKRESYEIGITNRKSAAIAFELIGEVYSYMHISSEDHRHVMDKGDAVWRLTLAPGERATVRFDLDY